MNIAFDKKLNLAYLYMRRIADGEVASTYTLDSELMGHINIDVDERGAILGIEFLDPEKQLAAYQEGLK